MEKFRAFIQHKWVALICRFLLSALFLIGAFAKLQDVKLYSVNVVYEYGLLPVEPVDLAAAFGYVLPFVELGVGLALLFGVLTKLAALGGALMGLSFSIAEGLVLLSGRDIDCGCFGGLIDTLTSLTVYLSAAMMVMGLIIYKSPNRNSCSLTTILFTKFDEIPKILRLLS